MSTLSQSLPETGAVPPATSSSNSRTWLYVVSHLDPKYGGISAVVPELSSAVASIGLAPPALAGFCAPGEHYRPPGSGAPVTYWPTSRLAWLRQRSLRSEFHQLVLRANGLHIHGLWEQSTAVAAKAARRLGKPYIVSAHGMLERWALANKRLKKQIYSALIERANLEGATCLHALTLAEAEDFRRFGSKRPIAVIPNGIQVPASPGPGPLLQCFPFLQHKRIVLFLGRLHFKKGLDLLIRSWNASGAGSHGAHLVLAGPASEGTRVHLQSLVEQFGLSRSVTFTGMLSGALKWSALAAAHCFVLPSYSEGLSVSTLEALAMGVPVLISDRCHLPEVARHGCGWIVPTNEKDLTVALDQALATSSDLLEQMGASGRRLARERYSWSVVASHMSELYQWAEGGARPTSFPFITL